MHRDMHMCHLATPRSQSLTTADRPRKSRGCAHGPWRGSSPGNTNPFLTVNPSLTTQHHLQVFTNDNEKLLFTII